MLDNVCLPHLLSKSQNLFESKFLVLLSSLSSCVESVFYRGFVSFMNKSEIFNTIPIFYFYKLYNINIEFYLAYIGLCMPEGSVIEKLSLPAM